MTATILYYSHCGKTAQYAREVAMYLWSKGLNVSLSAISEYNPEKLKGTDILLLGCWTSGWFIFHQHPHNTWKEKAAAIPPKYLPDKIALFTTYKFRTGSMFNNMRRSLHLPKDRITTTFKSKTGFLTVQDKKRLDQLIGHPSY